MIRTLTSSLLIGCVLAIAPACAQENDADGGPIVSGDEVDDDFLVRVDASRMKGSEDAPVQIVEISDFQCGFCARFAMETMPAIDSAYIETGQVQFLYVHYPLPSHQQSYAASKASLCAGAQGEFWTLHDRIFETRDEWANSPNPGTYFDRLAQDIGIDQAEYRACVQQDRVASVIINDILQIARAGIGGTPAFIINGETLIQGHQTFEEMSQHIENALAQRENGEAMTEDGEEGE